MSIRCAILVVFTLLLFQLDSLTASNPYFQQRVHYTIDVTLDDLQHVIRGSELINYVNQSPDTLTSIYFHLWPNAYRDENTVLAKSYFNDADMRFIRAGEKGRGYIDSLDFTINGALISWELLTDTPDVALLHLHHPLVPGDSIRIETPFKVKFPSAGISRLGHSGQAYYATQWYPKPAVYDNDGWKYMPYVDKGEFYSEFGLFDVTLTLPENYVVGATGELVNGEKETEWLTQKSQETLTITEYTKEDMASPISSTTFKTLQYRQDNVHDFAWFADKRWHVLKSSMVLPKSNDRVTIWAYFTNNNASYWMKSPEYMQRAVRDYSIWLGDYPYRQVTAVDVVHAKGANMEYPMITAIGSVSSAYQLDAVLAHELGHNWLYGILGSDERRHPWQDEGINSFYEKRYLFTEYASDSTSMNEYFNRMGRWGKWTKNTRMDQRLKQYYRYLGDARSNSDQAPDTRSEYLTLRNYSDMVYAKTSLGFQYLLNYLGDSLLDAAMNAYYETWKFQHPSPTDFQQSLEKSTGKNLDWLFYDWITSTRKLDYKVTLLEADSHYFEIGLKNTGAMNGPVAITRKNTDGSLNTYWLDGFNGDTTVQIPGAPNLPNVIDANYWMPESNRKNNSMRMNGLLRKTEPLQFRLWTDMEDESRTQLYLAPAVGWNLYNSVMAGAVIHNVGYPKKRFEFAAMPMYALGTKDLTGGGYLSYHLLPSPSVFKDITLRSGIQRYAYGEEEFQNDSINEGETIPLNFIRIENVASIDFLNHHPRNNLSNNLTLRYLFIAKDEYTGTQNETSTIDYNYYELTFTNENRNPWNGYKHTLNIVGNREFYRIWAEGSHRIPYSNPAKGLEVGIAGGYLVYDGIKDYRLRLSGRTGTQDYLFDEVFLGRSETSGILSQQFLAADGGFGINTEFYRYAEKWMAVFHLKADFPGKLPVKAYVNLGKFDNSNRYYPVTTQLSAEGGLEISIIKDIFNVYLPLVYSNDIQYAVDREQLNFGERIRFELHIKKLNPLLSLNR